MGVVPSVVVFFKPWRDFPRHKIGDSIGEDLPFGVLGFFSPLFSLCLPKFLCHILLDSLYFDLYLSFLA
jgi:hypothetical protein